MFICLSGTKFFMLITHQGAIEMISFWHVQKIVETLPFGRTTDQDVMDTLEASFKRFLATADHKSLLRKFLTKDVFESIKHRKTKSGATLYNVIKSGLEIPDCKIGLYAVDKECHSVFAALFDPVIAECHPNFKSGDCHPACCFGDLGSLRCLDMNQHFILSTTVTCSRNLRKFSFGPRMSEVDYKEIEALMSGILKNLDHDLKGLYHSLVSMTRNSQEDLQRRNFLLTRDDRHLAAADWFRFWPTGRGVFHNKKMDFSVWVNGEDHVIVISSQDNGDLRSVYTRLVHGMDIIGSELEYCHDDRLGYVTSCPSKLGTGMTVVVVLTLPLLSSRKDVLRKFAEEFDLDIKLREIAEKKGEEDVESEAESVTSEESVAITVVEVRNTQFLGVTEYEVISKIQECVSKMIKKEKELETEF